MNRVINFSAGPAVLPQAVLQQAASELLDWHGSGMSVMEMSHRGEEYISIQQEAELLLRELLAVPPNYKVLFMQGGGMGQNAVVPLNLIGRTGRAGYVVTGEWSKKSANEATKYGVVKVVASSESEGFAGVPEEAAWELDERNAYVHICANETIGGVQYHWAPETGSVPLVADMSSEILSRPIDVSRYGLIYAGAQKNMGPSGVTVVIVREDLLGSTLPVTPSVFDYRLQVKADSMHNTPPTFAIYMLGLVCKHVKAMGGLAVMEAESRAKAKLLYEYLDGSDFYVTKVRPQDRSRMNVPFFLKDASLENAFLKGAQARGMIQLKGHRSVGGMRASLYNAMPLDGVRSLVEYLREFEDGARF